MKSNSNLEFRKIKSLNFLYEVNENGTIFRNVKSKKQSKIVLDMHHSKTGYYRTAVHLKGETKRIMIHQVVAECWLGDCPKGLEIDHIDRNSKNNDYHNLRYVNHSEQMKNRKLSDKVINQAKQNCAEHIQEISKKVAIKNKTEIIEFKSMTKCAEFLAQKYNTKIETERYKLKRHRSHIHEYDIIYSECRD